MSVINDFPAFSVKNGSFEIGDGRAVEAELLEEFKKEKEVLEKYLPAVGRLEIRNQQDKTANILGTGWLVKVNGQKKSNIIVTNRHVLVDNHVEDVIKDTITDHSLYIHFLEQDGHEAYKCRVDKIIWMAPSSLPDIAFLRLAEMVEDREAVELDSNFHVQEGDYLAVIGYPIENKEKEPQLKKWAEEIFEQLYRSKCLSLGHALKVESKTLFHDCSTCSGHSGSLVLRFSDGSVNVVGLHYNGRYLGNQNMKANKAVPATIIQEKLDKHIPPPTIA